MEKEDLLKGLDSKDIEYLQKKYGKNILTKERKNKFIVKIFHIITEPMFLLLIVAAVIYFVLGNFADGLTMLVFVLGIIFIDVVQQVKTDKSLEALKKLSAPNISVIRNGKKQEILSENLVAGDLMIISEGVKIPADGKIIKSSALFIDESTLTGESVNVYKTSEEDKSNNYWHSNYCYAGTLVTRGIATVLVEKIGLETEYGKISKNLEKAPEIITPLQNQISKLVKICAILSLILFILVTIIMFFNLNEYDLYERLIDSILSGITLAMATIPEEFPVILTVFLSIGAWKLSKKNSLVRNLNSVETLGSVSVLCVDKTGTITLNNMKVEKVFNIKNNTDLNLKMKLGCLIDTYDPMEKAIVEYSKNNNINSFKLVKEYAFNDETKMMGNVWKKENKFILVAKGSLENIINISNLSENERLLIETESNKMYKEGLRVIALAEASYNNEKEIKEKLCDCKLKLIALIGLIDPPRDTVKEDIKKCIKAGVHVVMITGDNGITASAIAKKIGMQNTENIITGIELDKMTDLELKERIKNTSIFSRVIPEQKMKIIKAFKDNGEVVAMTGDGVNDAPALKYSDIGISMGKRGSEVAREASNLILLDDNFSTIVDTIEDGRRIYDNIRKSIEYIFTIHIPIILSSLIAPLLGIDPNNLFLLPIHIVLLELIIDPTCSIILERQPAEENIMNHPPRNKNEKIVTRKILLKSIIQGIFLFISSFLTYYIILVQNPENILLARTMGLGIIFISNILLVQVNSSNRSIFKTLIYNIKDKVVFIIFSVMILGILILIYSPLNSFMKLTSLNIIQILIILIISFISILWFEIVKIVKK